jgi:hypothetical protein
MGKIAQHYTRWGLVFSNRLADGDSTNSSVVMMALIGGRRRQIALQRLQGDDHGACETEGEEILLEGVYLSRGTCAKVTNAADARHISCITVVSPSYIPILANSETVGLPPRSQFSNKNGVWVCCFFLLWNQQ